MSSSRKMLKLTSMAAVLTAVGYLVIGLMISGLGMFGGNAVSAGDHAALFAGVSGVTALCFVVMGFMGMRASNVPSRSATSIACAGGSLAAIAVNALFWMWQGFATLDVANGVMMVLGVVEALAILLLARKVKAEREVWH